MTDAVVKLLAAMACFTVGLGVGGAVGTKAAQNAAAREKAELQAQAAEQRADLEKQYREKEKQDAKRVSDAIAERDKALADLRDSRADLSRLRKSAEVYRAKLSRASGASGSACKPYVDKLSECSRLLEEGVELGTEGSRLLREVAADKDALAKIVTPQ